MVSYREMTQLQRDEYARTSMAETKMKEKEWYGILDRNPTIKRNGNYGVVHECELPWPSKIYVRG